MNRPGANRALAVSTISFAIAFAVWGMIAPMAKTFQTELHLTESQVWLVIAVPVILGSIRRLPIGMLADRYGGRTVFSLLLFFIALPALFLSYAHSYGALLTGGLLLGIAGTSFAVGIAMVSRWFPPEEQGLALGVYGAGNIGQSIALFGVPVLAKWWGWPGTYRLFAGVAVAWAIIFLLLARDAPAVAAPKGL